MKNPIADISQRKAARVNGIGILIIVKLESMIEASSI